MCDNQVFRSGGRWVFAKNSDREPSEPQRVVRLEPVVSDQATNVRTTYISVAQTARRNGVILSQPTWLWGAEMGCNDQGLVIGNTAIFTKTASKNPALLGMDMLRLALERSSNAQEAIEVIAELLRLYGQGGPCGFRDKSLIYDNSFVLVDPQEAWVLETAEKHWVAKRVESVAATSNTATIGQDYDRSSKGIEDFARQRGDLKRGQTFDFKRCFEQTLMPMAAAAPMRLGLSMSCMKADLNGISEHTQTTLAGQAMNRLRSHRFEADLAVARGNYDVCMHAGGFIRRSQTTSSWVSVLGGDDEQPKHFVTGTSAPCLSVFRPVGFWPRVESTALATTTTADHETLWWRNERLHRTLLFDAAMRTGFRFERDAVERAMLSDVAEGRLFEADIQVEEWHRGWIRLAQEQHFQRAKPRAPTPYAMFWNQLDRIDRMWE